MTQEEQKELLSRYLEGTCTNEERILIETWYKDITIHATDPEPVDFEAVEQIIWQRLDVHMPKPRLQIYKWWMAAAAVIAVLFIPVVVFLENKQSSTQPAAVVTVDVSAGGSKAILQLADGSQVALDQAKDGQIAHASGVIITKTGKGQITYQIKEQPSNNTVSYNTVITPNGGQYQIILPDKTVVTLNAASSLRYPTQFASSERMVSLTGEAYFDVKRNPHKPFIVASPEQEVKVLGTHFNVSCYANEPIKTTLEEGMVEISKQNSTQKTTLKPGYQSIVTSHGIEVRQVNPKTVTAWKDGMFVFYHTSMKDVMKQFSRWYNVDVDYSIVPDKAFDGELPRNLSLLKVLEIVNANSEYQFTLEERRIVRNNPGVPLKRIHVQ